MSKDKVTAIIQARLGSSRLPLKSLLCLENLPIIDWVATRAKKAALIDKVIVALPDTELDSILLKHLKARGITCHTGSETDVLGRVCKTASAFSANIVIRICADNPLIDAEALDNLVEFYRETKPDYAYNHIPRNNSWPDGLGAEILSFDLLREINNLATLPAQREHCMNYIWDNAENYAIATFNPGQKYLQRPDIKLDVDSVEDFKRLSSLNPRPEMKAHEIVEAWDKAFQRQYPLNKVEE